MDKLPSVLLQEIIQELDTASQFNLSLVNKKLRQLARPIAWKKLCLVIDNRWLPEPPRIGITLNNDVKLPFKPVYQLEVGFELVEELELTEYAKPLPVLSPKSELYVKFLYFKQFLKNIKRVTIKRDLLGRTCKYKTLAEQFFWDYAKKLEVEYTVLSISQIPEEKLYRHKTTKLATLDMPVQYQWPARLDFISFVYEPGSDSQLKQLVAKIKALEVKGHELRFEWVPKQAVSLSIEAVNEPSHEFDMGDVVSLDSLKELALVCRGTRAAAFSRIRAPNVEKLSICFDELEDFSPIVDCIKSIRSLKELFLYCPVKAAAQILGDKLATVTVEHVHLGQKPQTIDDVRNLLKNSDPDLITIDLDHWNSSLIALPYKLGVTFSDSAQWKKVPVDEALIPSRNGQILIISDTLRARGTEAAEGVITRAIIASTQTPGAVTESKLTIILSVLFITLVAFGFMILDFYPNFYADLKRLYMNQW